MADSTDKSTDKSGDKSTADKPSPTARTGTASTGSKADSETTDNRPPAPPARDGQAPGTDPRLDNRTGDQAPQPGPMPPQQVHGGYPGDESDDEDPPSGKPSDPNRSEGPHGRGPQVGPSSDD
jgi:hypothetical protein